MKTLNVPLNIPNILSLYRLFSFPFIMIFVFLGEESLFAFFICFNLFTDFLDGWIARKFNQKTEIGAKLDSMADTGLYVLAVTGILIFKWADFKPHLVSFSPFLFLLVLTDLIPLIKFGKFNSFHIYSSKAGGYIKGAFFIVLFCFGFITWFYYFMIITGMLAYVENIVITILSKEPGTDVKGLWWLLRKM